MELSGSFKGNELQGSSQRKYRDPLRGITRFPSGEL